MAGRPARRSRPSGIRLYDPRRRSPVSCAARAKGARVSSARCCRGTMAPQRGEAGGCWDWGLGTPRGAVASGRQRWSAPVGGRPSSAPAGLWGPGARPGRRAAGVCVEPLSGLSARRRRLWQCGAASLPLRLPSSRRTPRWTVRRPETAPASTSWQWVGTEFRQTRRGAGAQVRGWRRITQRKAGPVSVLAGVTAAAISAAPPALGCTEA